MCGESEVTFEKFLDILTSAWLRACKRVTSRKELLSAASQIPTLRTTDPATWICEGLGKKKRCVNANAYKEYEVEKTQNIFCKTFTAIHPWVYLITIV